MKNVLITLLVLFVPLTLHAQADTRLCTVGGSNGRVLNAVALNGSAATRTFTIGAKNCHNYTGSFRWLVLEVDYTYTTDGNVLFTCTTGQKRTTATKTPQTCVGTGTCVSVDGGIVSTAVTANKEYAVRLGIRGYRAWSCVVSHDNTPAAGDIVTTHAYLTD